MLGRCAIALDKRTMPNKFSTELVSIVPIAGTSTFSNECCGLKGIVKV